MEKYKEIEQIHCSNQSTADLILAALENKGFAVVVGGVPGVKMVIQVLEKYQ